MLTKFPRALNDKNKQRIDGEPCIILPIINIYPIRCLHNSSREPNFKSLMNRILDHSVE